MKTSRESVSGYDLTLQDFTASSAFFGKHEIETALSGSIDQIELSAQKPLFQLQTTDQLFPIRVVVERSQTRNSRIIIVHTFRNAKASIILPGEKSLVLKKELTELKVVHPYPFQVISVPTELFPGNELIIGFHEEKENIAKKYQNNFKGVSPMSHALPYNMTYVGFKEEIEGKPSMVASLDLSFFWTTVLSFPENSQVVEAIRINSLISYIPLPFEMCFSTFKKTNNERVGSVVMAQYQSANEFSADDHRFFFKSSHECVQIKTMMREKNQEDRDGSITFFGLNAAHFNYEVEISVSMKELVKKLYIMNFWPMVATTINMLLFMFYLHLRTWSKNTDEKNDGQRPLFPYYIRIIFTRVGFKKIFFLNLFSSVFRLYFSDILRSMMLIAPRNFTDQCSVDVIFTSIVSTFCLITSVLALDLVHLVCRNATKFMLLPYFDRLDTILVGF